MSINVCRYAAYIVIGHQGQKKLCNKDFYVCRINIFLHSQAYIPLVNVVRYMFKYVPFLFYFLYLLMGIIVCDIHYHCKHFFIEETDQEIFWASSL